MIQNFSVQTQISYDLEPLAGKSVELRFSGSRISSDGGLLLLRAVKDQIGLIADISSCITDNRNRGYIDHAVYEMVSQRVFQIAAGFEDCNDSNVLSSDMVIEVCSGHLSKSKCLRWGQISGIL